MFAVLLACAAEWRAPSAIAWAGCGCALGILLAAVPFIPTTELTELSVAKYRADYLGTGGGLYWQSLVSLVAPNHYNIFDMARFNGPWDPTFLYLYSSIGGLLLAIFALLACRSRTTALFALMLLSESFWMLGDKTIVWRGCFHCCRSRCASESIPNTPIASSAWQSRGWRRSGWMRCAVRDGARWAIGVVIAADLFLVGSGRPMNVASLKTEPGVTRDAFDGSTVLLNQVRRYVNQNDPPWRFDTVDASMEWTNGAPILQIPSAAGISPMALENAIQLRLFLHDGYRWGWNYPLEKLDSPVVDLLNMRYIITRGQDISRMAAYPRYRHIASLPGNELFENRNVFPRFFLVHQVRTVGSLKEARDVMSHRPFDLRKTAIVEQADGNWCGRRRGRSEDFALRAERHRTLGIERGGAACWCFRKLIIRVGGPGWTISPLPFTRPTSHCGA